MYLFLGETTEMMEPDTLLSPMHEENGVDFRPLPPTDLYRKQRTRLYTQTDLHDQEHILEMCAIMCSWYDAHQFRVILLTGSAVWFMLQQLPGKARIFDTTLPKEVLNSWSSSYVSLLKIRHTADQQNKITRQLSFAADK